MFNSSSLGQRLRVVRKSKNLSQGGMAASLGFKSRGFWSELEAGKKEPTGTLILLLSEIHNVSRDWLLTGEGEMWKASPAIEVPPEIELSERIEPEGDIKALLKEALNEEKAGENTHKLILAYLEELLALSRAQKGEASARRETRMPEMRRTAESRLSGWDSPLIPKPPRGLKAEEQARWERNAGALERWMGSEAAIWVPRWALERFCRDVEGMLGGGKASKISGLLKDFMEEGKKPK